MSTCVIVAGTYRSGTSLLARFLDESGCDMNPAPVQSDIAGWHPTGSYRDAILESGMMTSWPDYFVKRSTSGTWGVKSHFLLFVPGMLTGFLASCPADRRILIWTTRPAAAAANSWAALRQDLPAEIALERITAQVNTLQTIYDAWAPADKLSIEFPEVTQDPEAQLRGVADLIGLPFSADACAHIRADIPKWG